MRLRSLHVRRWKRIKGSFQITTLLAEKRWRNPTIFPFSNALAQEIVEDLERLLTIPRIAGDLAADLLTEKKQ